MIEKLLQREFLDGYDRLFDEQSILENEQLAESNFYSEQVAAISIVSNSVSGHGVESQQNENK